MRVLDGKERAPSDERRASHRMDAEPCEEPLSLCTLRVGQSWYGIDTRAIREVLGKARLHAVPLAPAFVAGVLAYRGDVLTAISVRVLLGETAGELGTESSHCVLVLDGDEMEERFALVVDGVGGVTMVEDGTMAANPPTLDDASRELFRGAFRTDAGLLVQLDPVRLQPSRVAASGLFRGSDVRHGSELR
jgi:purine-binding chemotaxis protein CheW